MSPASARRFHLLFQSMDFEALRPLFDDHCLQGEYGGKYRFLENFDELVEYAKALDELLIRAIELNRMLYISVSA